MYIDEKNRENFDVLGNVSFDDPAEFGLSRLAPLDESSDDEKSNRAVVHNESTRPVSRRVIAVLLDERKRRSRKNECRLVIKLKESFKPSLLICGPSDFFIVSKQSLTSAEERNV
jgi:hypothetical protein